MIYFSELIKSDLPKLYSELSQALDKHGVKHGLLLNTKDYWCRDYMPFPLGDSKYLRYIYNPDYLRNFTEKREYITDPKPVCETLKLDCIDTDILIDGGNIVRCGDKIVMIDKVYNENPQYGKDELKAKLEELFNTEIIFLPWDKKGEKYGHSDGLVRYIGNGKVLLTNYKDYNSDFHEKFRTILSEHFEVEELSYTQPNCEDNSWAYINFLQTDKLIILPKLGTHKDSEALAQIKKHFPKHKIEQIEATEIVKQGGAFNCISWNV